MKTVRLMLLLQAAIPPVLSLQVFADSAGWQSVIWREPQVRSLLVDMTVNGGRTDLCRKCATEERDPDSREAIRLWDAGVRAVNTNHFERAGGRSPKLVFRGTDKRLDPAFFRLNSDEPRPVTNVRCFMADIALGGSTEFYRAAERVTS